MTYKTIAIKPDISILLEKCKEEFLDHHPELQNMPISYNKIIYEIAKFYLK